MASDLGGREVRLHNIPSSFNAASLKVAIRDALNIQSYDFLVVLEKTAEDLVWDFTDAVALNTARLIMPDSQGTNVLDKLNSLEVQDTDGSTVRLAMDGITSPITRKEKFSDLNARAYINPKIKPGILPDGIIGTVVSIDLCTFNDAGAVSIAKTWTTAPEAVFNKFSFFSNEAKKRFQVCLLEDRPATGTVWEWCDIHLSNLRGVVADPTVSPQGTKTVYFITDKPPQFYRRSTEDGGESFTSSPEKELSPRALDKTNVLTMYLPAPTSPDPDVRIRYPSGFTKDASSTFEISKIPWEVQFCRVYKVEYRPQPPGPGLSFDSFSLQLTKPERENIVVLTSHILTANPTTTLLDTLMSTMTKISEQPGLTQTPLLKLLYNCNVSPFSDSQVSDLLESIRTSNLGPLDSQDGARKLAVLLERSAHVMETAHRRVLRRLHNATDNDPVNTKTRLPSQRLGPAVNIDAAVAEILNNIYFQSQLPSVTRTPKVFTFMVYPSHLEIYGPDVPPENSVLQNRKDQIERFIRVRFLDNDGKPFRLEPLVSPDKIITHRIFKILNSDTPLFDLARFPTQTFEYLGYSVSSLKKRKMVWFYQKDTTVEPTDAKRIRDSIGLWDVSNAKAKPLAKAPWKWGARIALAFTTSTPIEDLDSSRWAVRPDFPADAKNPNTDGCGMISQSLCSRINDVLARSGYHPSTSFQIRFGGVKGVVHTAPAALFRDFPSSVDMVLRDSQVKFDVPPATSKITLRVVSTAAESQCCLYSPPVLKALEDMGCNVSGIKESFKQAFSVLSTLSGSTIDFLREVLRVPFQDAGVQLGSTDSLLKLAVALKNHNIEPQSYSGSFLGQYLQSVCRSRMTKKFFEIPIPNSYFTLGLTDDYDLLNKDELYIRAGGITVEGAVLIYRSPVIHIGDIQRATGLSDDDMAKRIRAKHPNQGEADQVLSALQASNNVVYFSQNDQNEDKEIPPLPNKLSGGDLDGDRFEIISLKDDHYWGHGIEPRAWSKYKDEKGAEKANAWDIRDLCQFISEYIRNDCFDALENALEALADMKSMDNADVKEFSTFISNAVDYVKNGAQVDFRDVTTNEKFRIESKPDFMQGLSAKLRHDATGQYYPSPNLLGEIFRARQKDLEKLGKQDPDVDVVLDNGPLIEALQKLPLVENGDLSKDNISTDKIQAMRTELEISIRSYSQVYRGYLKGRHVRSGREMEIFLSSKPLLDNFPQPHVTSLVDGILQVMVSAGLITLETNEVARSQGFRIRLVQGTTREVARRVFKNLAMQAWTNALSISQKYKGDGVSLAFLALYTFFCVELPAPNTLPS